MKQVSLTYIETFLSKIMKKSLIFIIRTKLFLIALFAIALQLSPPLLRFAEGQQFDHEHTLFAEILDRHLVQDGLRSSVDYSALKSDRAVLDEYLIRLSKVSMGFFNTFSETEKLAFLINAYNAFTLKLIVDNYPVSSIKKIGGIFSTPWEIKFFSLLGRPLSLDQIEHEMIRAWFSEPRIHFALVCASKGCPALRYEPYVPSRIYEQLEDATKKFLKDEGRNRYAPDERTLYLSSIFDWYKEDFQKFPNATQGFVAKYYLDNGMEKNDILSSKISFLSYDWTLNDKTSK